MQRLILSLLAGGLLASMGCGGPPDSRPLAEDPVCLAKGDLGCIRVRVDSSTPRAVYQGRTYYFCNDECRQEFEKDPEKYAKRGPQK